MSCIVPLEINFHEGSVAVDFEDVFIEGALETTRRMPERWNLESSP